MARMEALLSNLATSDPKARELFSAWKDVKGSVSNMGSPAPTSSAGDFDNLHPSNLLHPSHPFNNSSSAAHSPMMAAHSPINGSGTQSPLFDETRMKWEAQPMFDTPKPTPSQPRSHQTSNAQTIAELLRNRRVSEPVSSLANLVRQRSASISVPPPEPALPRPTPAPEKRRSAPTAQQALQNLTNALGEVKNQRRARKESVKKENAELRKAFLQTQKEAKTNLLNAGMQAKLERLEREQRAVEEGDRKRKEEHAAFHAKAIEDAQRFQQNEAALAEIRRQHAARIAEVRAENAKKIAEAKAAEAAKLAGTANTAPAAASVPTPAAVPTQAQPAASGPPPLTAVEIATLQDYLAVLARGGARDPTKDILMNRFRAETDAQKAAAANNAQASLDAKWIEEALRKEKTMASAPNGHAKSPGLSQHGSVHKQQASVYEAPYHPIDGPTREHILHVCESLETERLNLLKQLRTRGLTLEQLPADDRWLYIKIDHTNASESLLHNVKDHRRVEMTVSPILSSSNPQSRSIVTTQLSETLHAMRELCALSQATALIKLQVFKNEAHVMKLSAVAVAWKDVSALSMNHHPIDKSYQVPFPPEIAQELHVREYTVTARAF